jgi:altronate dehydratase
MLATEERVWCDASELILSLKCGGSDYTSGLASNPALGRVTDRLVDLGGSAVLGEIAEIMGAEHLLASRASDPTTGAQLIQIITRVEAGGARARLGHSRHAAVTRKHSWRPDDDRREVAGRDSQGR